MRRSLINLVALTMIWLGSCDSKEEVLPLQQLNCADLAHALLENDFQMVKTETAKFLGTEDNKGKHQEYLSKLISEIDKCSGLKVVDSCVGCIETNPLTSEIRMEIAHNNQVLTKVLDFRYSDHAFVLVNIHN